MKKFLASLALIFVVFSIVSANVKAAKNLDEINNIIKKQNTNGVVKPKFIVTQNQKNNNDFLKNTAYKFIETLIKISGGLSVLFIVYGSLRMAASAGKQETIDSSKKIITYALIGLIAVILSYTLVTGVIKLAYKNEHPPPIVSSSNRGK